MKTGLEDGLKTDRDRRRDLHCGRETGIGVKKFNMEAPFITPLKHGLIYKRGNNGQILANNEYSSEFREKYFLYRNARYAALTGGQRKDFGWYVLLKTMWPEWLKEGLTEITLIPERMELDYLYRMRPKIDSGSAKRGLCALNCACSARFS